MSGELSNDELAFLHGVLDLACDGRTDELVALIERGVPANLTNAAGERSATDVARFFGLDEMAALLAAAPSGWW